MWWWSCAVASAVEPAWQVAGVGGWNDGLVLSPTGELLVFADDQVFVLAVEDGRQLATAPACDPVHPDAVRWIDGAVTLICQRSLVQLSWPDLKQRVVASFPSRVEEGGIGQGLAVVSEDDWDGNPLQIRMYHPTGRSAGSFLAPGPVEALAVDPAGRRVAMSVKDVGVFERDLATETTRPIDGLVRTHNALGYSPDSASLFGKLGAFDYAVVRLEDEAVLGRWRGGSWITAVRWLPDGRLVASGSDGVGAMSPGSSSLARWGDGREVEVGLAVSDDGQVVCAASRSGRVRCYGDALPAPRADLGSAAVASSDERPPTATGDRGPGSGAGIEGTLRLRVDDTVTVTLARPHPWTVGQTGHLLKHFEQDLGGLSISGWLEIALIRIDGVHRDRVSATILEERSVIEVDGEVRSHFTAGARVKISP